jgi:transposase
MRYSLESRLRIVRLIERGETPERAAAALGASRASGYRLWRRYQDEGWQGLQDRRSTPKRQPRRLSALEEAQIVALRHELGAGPQVIAVILGRPVSTVGKVLRRAGCSRLPRPERVVRPRYERERPGELLHVDVKKLGRFWEVGKRIRKDGIRRSRQAGWNYLHIAIDVDRPRFGGLRVVRRLRCRSLFRTRWVSGSPGWSGVGSGCRRSRCSRRSRCVPRLGWRGCGDGADPL